MIIDDRAIEVVRFEYDIERETVLLLRSGYSDTHRIVETRREGRFVPISGP